MQSLNKMPSFGDNTLSACIRTEIGNLEVFHDDSDMAKYFRDSTLLSKVTDKSEIICDSSQSKQNTALGTVNADRSHPTAGNGSNARTTNSKSWSVRLRSNRSKVGSNNHLKGDHVSHKTGKENINADHKNNEVSLSTCVSKHDNKSDPLSFKASNTSTKTNSIHNVTEGTNRSKLLHSNITNNTEKSIGISCSASIISTQDRCKLAAWGLPPNILQKYESRGVFNMFPWQVECLSNHKVIEENRNLVYSAPTSAGKTLVAEILMIKTVVERQKKVIFILPFVSVVREKMYYFQDLLSDSGVRVEGFMGGIVPAGGFAATNVAIATIEKANSLINRLMEENELINLGAVIIDELHLVGDPNRGYLLELLLTKLKYMTLRDEHICIQLIGMSATLPNLSLLAKWLDAELYKTDFRPVPLNEQYKVDTSIYDNKLTLIRTLKPIPELTMDSDNILQLCIETISDGHSVLIFCPTKNWCEKLAEQIAAAFFKLGRENTPLGETLRQQLDSTLISETLEQLKRSPTGLDNVLKNTVSFGIAFHHAGLTMDERDIIEGSFRSGSLRVLVATSTLSSGVNLPARRVIIRSPMFGGKILDSLTYRQMIGRAGRMGKDTAGESILMCKSNERKAAEFLLSATLESIGSCLEDSGPLIRALLEAIASEVVYTPQDLELYTKCTLVNLCNDGNANDLAYKAIRFLIDNEFLLLQKTEEDHRWVATAFGKACLAASIPPRDGLFLLEELQKARRCFVLDTELHVVYLVTPVTSGNQILTIDWMSFLELWRMLSESERRVGELVGVEERFLTSAVKGIVRPGKSLRIHRRFYTALALHDLVRETPLNTVCTKYGCCRGVLQSLQQSASTFAGMVTQFCKQLGWDCMELLVSQFQARLQFGVCRELLDLLRLPMLNGLRARSLYKQGITCVADLAVANELDVERALYKALPFESEKEQDGEHESEALKRNKMRTVFVTGRDGLTAHEAAAMLVQEARVLVQNELGLQDMSWKQNEQSTARNGSRLESNLQVQQGTNESTKNVSTKTNHNVSVHTNLQTEVQQGDGTSQITHTNEIAVTKNDKLTNEEENLSNNKSCLQQLEIITDTIENCNDSKLNMEKDTITDTKDDHIKLAAPLEQSDTPLFFDSSIEKYSFNCFEDSSPKLIEGTQRKRDSESLISFKDIRKDRTQNIRVKQSSDYTENVKHTDVTPNKKLRISDEPGHINSLSLNAIIHGSDFEHITKSRVSRSPSLFDDSLNLDTQMCNVLEQNIIDSLQFSEFEQSKPSQLKLATGNVDITRSDNIKNVQLEDSTTNKPQKDIFDSSNLQAKHSSLSWKDDSWNESKGIMAKLNEIKNKNNENTITKSNIRNIKNTNTPYKAEIAGTSNSTPEPKRKCDKNSANSMDSSEDLRKISQRRRFKEIPADKSPVAKVILFSKRRTASLDSNKSDSDDIIIASQNINSPATSLKLRSKLNSERKRKIHTQKLPDRTPDDVRFHNVETKLNKIIARKVLASKDCSTDSVISNSDDDGPVDSVKTLQKSTIILKKLQTKPMASLPPKETQENGNETTNWNTLNIIKVGSDRSTFNLFKRELMQRRYVALALNCEMYTNDINNIGSKIISSTNTERKKRSKKEESLVHAQRKLCGAAISWENNTAYYISFSNLHELKISGKEQMKLFKELLSNTLLHVKCFATKEIFKVLYECCGISASCKFLDPKVATWLYDGNIYEKSFNEMVAEHFPRGCSITKRIGSCHETGPGLKVKSTIPGEFRASAEAVLTWHMTNILLDKLEKLSPTLLYTYKDVEMKTVTSLACMELTGLGVCLKSLQDLSSVISQEMTSLEERAYALCGKKFNFSSSREVGQVLGLYKGKKVSVNKAVLGQCDHPISSLVMSWRKLNATQSKMVYPLLNLAQREGRIHGNCVTNTLTGRISMHEPNLQNVPKDFNSEDNSFVISVRMAFVPILGNVILSADYCQLELRILAHFSKDMTLCEIMRQPGDIFRNIAARWNNVSEGQVDDKMRQHTKQLCYGMIYGMGVRTLAESLSVEETQAREFLESFMNTYPGIRQWLDNVVEEAREKGYVSTLLERRRMLPELNSTNSSEKSQAERQAVNTKVQGSAADIAKKAMVNIEERMRFEFSNSTSVMPITHSKRKLRSSSREAQQRGGYLILQLHDELLYEVNMNDLQKVAIIVKESMEQVCQLAVPLPVKIKVGPAWGDLSEYNI